MRFDELDLEYDVLDALDAMHFTECTPIRSRPSTWCSTATTS